MRELFKKRQKEAALKLRRALQKLPSIDPHDPAYRRLKYTRYADDFGLAFTGPKSEAEEIKQQLGGFLYEELKLNLSEDKTLITHVRSAAATFLCNEITTLQIRTKQSRTKGGYKRRSINRQGGWRVPPAMLINTCNLNKQHGHRT